MKFLVLSDHSIMMDGIISRLSTAREDVFLHVGSRSERLGTQVERLKPDVVILEKSAMQVPGYCSLNTLFDAYPNLILVEVDPNTAELQIVGSQQLQPKGFSELMQYLVTVSSNLATAHPSQNLESV